MNKNEASVCDKMRVLTPTRSIELLDNYSKLDPKIRSNSQAEMRGSTQVGHHMYPAFINVHTTNDSTSSITEKSVRLSAQMPGNIRNVFDNNEIANEIRKHCPSERRQQTKIDEKESKRLKEKMGELYSKIIHRNYEIDTVKFTIKKLDKKVEFLKHKALKM
jgi:hypothetical protein